MERTSSNYAADLAANSWLEDLLPSIRESLASRARPRQIEITDPPGWLVPQNFNFPRGLMAEEYERLLPPPIQIQIKCGGKKGKGQGGKGEGEGGGNSDQPDVGRGKCGSCADGKDAPWEIGSPEDSGTEGVSRAELEVKVLQAAKEIVEHAKKSRGFVPGGMLAYAEAQLRPPKVSWRQQLRAVCRDTLAWAAGSTAVSWQKLSRRSSDEILFPGRAHPVPPVAIVLDTSGSMSDDMICKEAFSEIQGVIASQGHVAVPVLACDAQVGAISRVADVRRVKVTGRGGTDMRVGIDVAAALKPKPKVIIVVTDGYTGWGDGPVSGSKVIACIIGDPEHNQKPPDWVKALWVDGD
jgi:hypothetical protein